MKGIYVLLISLYKTTDVLVGALGSIQFKKGLYAYVGSAQNSLELRINRHLSGNKKVHWHIDYLLEKAEIVQVFIAEMNKESECIIAGRIIGTPIRGFGCSDCRCNSHLFLIEDEEQFIDMGFHKH